MESTSDNARHIESAQKGLLLLLDITGLGDVFQHLSIVQRVEGRIKGVTGAS